MGAEQEVSIGRPRADLAGEAVIAWNLFKLQRV